MRSLLLCALALASMASFGKAAAPVYSKKLTIVLDFRGPHSAQSIAEMKHELEGIMQGSGLAIDWRLRDEASQDSFDNLVVVRFNGKCILEPVPFLYDERGPYAFTYSTEGVLQPFSEVACDRITSSVRAAMFTGDYVRADQLLGRALGRVVAHELIHMLSRSDAHGREGVAKPSLSGSQLIADHLNLSPADLERVRALPH